MAIRIALISNLYPSETNPSRAVFVKNIENALENIGAVTTHRCVIKGQSFSIHAKAFNYALFFLRTLWVGLFGAKIDLIYAHYATHCAPPLLIAGLFRKRRIVVNVHGADVIPHNGFERAVQPFARQLLRKASVIVAPSAYFGEILKTRIPDIGDRIRISPSGGIDGSVFYTLERVADLKRKYGIPFGQFVLGFVSRIEKEKGWRLFIDLVGSLRDNGFKVTGFVIGDGSEIVEMKEKIRERMLIDTVLYLGRRTQSELREIYNALDVFIFPTVHDSESLGLVGLEAMACGTPVIASNIGGPGGYVSHGKNGYLFPPGDLAALIECTKKMVADESSRQPLRTGALATAAQFESKKVISELYRELVIAAGQECRQDAIPVNITMLAKEEITP